MIRKGFTQLIFLATILVLLTSFSGAGTVSAVTLSPGTFSCSDVTEIPRAECEALVALYNSTNGPNWADNSGWLTTNTPCSWAHVGCSMGHVNSLSPAANRLIGTIPAELGNLVNLWYLHLGNNRPTNWNQLTGTIPPELGNLANLQWLSLYNNQLSGTIPSEFGHLTNLQSLGLWNNQLSGTIPPELGNLTNLQYLNLFDNQLTGPIPTWLGAMTSLEGLDLSSNQLTGTIPRELGNLTNLLGLSLGDNPLTGSLPPELGNLTNLQELGLWRLNLSGTIPAWLRYMTNLESLDLSSNRFSGTIPIWIGSMTKLESIALAANQLTGIIPPELGNLPHLQALILSGNQLTGTIPSELGNLTNMLQLWLSYNQLTGTIPHEMGNLGSLTRLYLEHNPLSGPLPFELTHLTHLANFWFNDTGLCEPDETGFQAWLASIPDVQSTNVLCESPRFQISGRVTDSNGTGLSGVTVTAGTSNALTDSSGNYTLSGLLQGSYTVTPSKSSYTFSPASRVASVPPSVSNISFTGYDRPPIVFVHGWNGLNDSCDWVEPNSYFHQVDDLLRNAGYYVAYANLESSSCYTPPIEENVWRLDNAIQLAKAATNRSQVILISHSMGGLVARAYLEGDTYDDDVAHLFTFGSPHLGVPTEALLVYLGPTAGLGLGAYCILQPAVCDFSTLGMISFNARHSDRRSGVSYHVVSGDAPLTPRESGAIAMGLFLRSIGILSDDGVVGTYSGLGLANVSDTLRTQETHGSGSGPHNYFIWDDSSQLTQSYQQCLAPVLVSRTSESCGTNQEGEVATAEQSTPTASTPIKYGTIMPEQTLSNQAVIDMGATLFSAQWTDGTVEMSLIKPSGQVIDPAYAATHPNEVSYASSPGYATYDLSNAPAGTWQIRLRAIDVPTVGSQTMTFALFESSQTLSVGVDASWYRPGATAVFTATLVPTPQNASVVATVLLADASSTSLTLSHLGGGQYRGSYTAPAKPGYAEVRFRATGINSSGIAFEQGASQAFQIAPDTVALRGNYSDTPEPRWPGATIYQALNISVGVDVNTTGSYGLSGLLVDGAGNPVAHANVIAELSNGAGTLMLRFNGADIFQSGLDGPYRLTDLLLTDHNGTTLVVQEAQNVYTTAVYRYRDFRTGDLFLPLIMK